MLPNISPNLVLIVIVSCELTIVTMNSNNNNAVETNADIIVDCVFGVE